MRTAAKPLARAQPLAAASEYLEEPVGDSLGTEFGEGNCMNGVDHGPRPENESLADLSGMNCGTGQIHGVAGGRTSYTTGKKPAGYTDS